jgi:hypothetical protein
MWLCQTTLKTCYMHEADWQGPEGGPAARLRPGGRRTPCVAHAPRTLWQHAASLGKLSWNHPVKVLQVVV